MYSAWRCKSLLLSISIICSYANAQDYKIYFGDMHSHTSFSDGQSTPAAAFKYARLSRKADFLTITDHCWIDYTEWEETKAAADSETTDEFLAIRGFEMTTTWGHMNIFNTEWYFPDADMQSFYSILSADKNCIAQWNHPTEYSREFHEFSHYSEELDDAINLLEIMNMKRYTRYDSSYVRALDKGWHLSPTIGFDMHGSEWITAYDARTAVIATGLTHDEFYAALRNCRTYATEDRNLHVLYTINGSLMGSVLRNPSKCNVQIQANDTDTLAGDKIRLIQIFSCHGQIVASKVFDAYSVTWNTVLDLPDSGDLYYFVKITNGFEKTAVTAPVWIEIRKSEKPEKIETSGKNKQTTFDISGRLVRAQFLSQVKRPAYRLTPGVYVYKYEYKQSGLQSKYCAITQ